MRTRAVKNACAEFQEELALCAVESRSPSAPASSHLLECGLCQKTSQEVQKAALACRFAAADLPTPNKSLALQETWKKSRAPAWSIPLKPTMAGAMAAAVVGLVLFNWLPGKSPQASTTNEPPGVTVESRELEVAAQPTLNLYRQQADDEEFTPEISPAQSLTHLRVKDAYSDWN